MSLKKRCRPGTKSFGATCVKTFKKAVALILFDPYVEALSQVRQKILKTGPK